MFEREGDYMRCLAVEDQEEMKDWVLSIRSTKVTHYKKKYIYILICYIYRVIFNINIIQTEW